MHLMFLMLTLCGFRLLSSSYTGLPRHFGSPNAMESLRQHQQWLVNFQRDVSMISSTARHHHADELQRIEDQYPLSNVR